MPNDVCWCTEARRLSGRWAATIMICGGWVNDLWRFKGGWNSIQAYRQLERLLSQQVGDERFAKTWLFAGSYGVGFTKTLCFTALLHFYKQKKTLVVAMVSHQKNLSKALLLNMILYWYLQRCVRHVRKNTGIVNSGVFFHSITLSFQSGKAKTLVFAVLAVKHFKQSVVLNEDQPMKNTHF